MGQFQAGTWIVGLLIYFTILFLVVYCVSAAVPDSGVTYHDPGYGTTYKGSSTIGNTSTTADVSTSSPGMSNIMTTLSVLTGVGSGSYVIGIPSGWAWLFSFMFFYIPLFMLLWAVYMALPIIH